MQRDKMGKWAIIIALAIVVVAGIIFLWNFANRRVAVTIGDQVVYAKVADSDAARTKGLSGTSSLDSNHAMLFVFDNSGRWGMWMKDMNYSLDILWLDSSKQIVHIERNVSPDTYPHAFLPDKDSKYVVELPAGFVSQHQIGLGQIASFSVN